MTVLCTVCDKDLPDEFTAETVADHWVWDIDGEIDYIELAHRNCAITDNAVKDAWASSNNEDSPDDYWNTNLPEQTDEEFEARKLRQGRA